VLVQAGAGRFEPREVKLGARSDDRVEVREGVREGEQVVVAANFLIDAESNLQAAVGGFGAAGQSAEAGKPKAASVGHQAEGKVEELDRKAGTAMISHGPVPSLNWPGMTMEFKFANEALNKDLKPGSRFGFEFVERSPGEWVITAVSPAKAAAHAGH
jgi:Cu/Ag efflux protein CusF